MKTKLLNIKFILSLLAVVISTICFAQQGINYQGVARDNNGQLMQNQNLSLKFNIREGSIDGENVYSETHETTTDVNGVFSVIIGEGIPVLNTFEEVNWANEKHFLNVWLNLSEMGTTEFRSTPYTKSIGKWQSQINGLETKGTGGSIYIGDSSGIMDDLSDNNNIGLGDQSLEQNEEGSHNVALGKETLNSNTLGNYNTAIGYQTLYNNRDGNLNLGIGYQTLYSNISGIGNIGIGFNALYDNISGRGNIAMGIHTMWNNTTGSHNIAMAEGTLIDNLSGDRNIAMGYYALNKNTIGDDNIALGFESMKRNTTGWRNIGFGANSLRENTTGKTNIAIGKYALEDNVWGDENVAIGVGALKSLNHPEQYKGENTAIGTWALGNSITGERNTAVGYGAGSRNNGYGNIFIGAFAGSSIDYQNIDHTLIIENSSSTLPLIYGEFDNNILGFNARVGIGTETPNVPLQVTTGSDADLGLGSGMVVLGSELSNNLVLDKNEIQARNAGAPASLYLQQNGGNVYIGNAIIQSSDIRLKRDINDISFGLEEILKLRPTEYFWKTTNQQYKSLGLIAQEVQGVIRNVVTYNEEQDKYGVSYSELIPVLIKAIQEQQKIIDSHHQQDLRLSSDLADLKEKVSQLEAMIAQSTENITKQ